LAIKAIKLRSQNWFDARNETHIATSRNSALLIPYSRLIAAFSLKLTFKQNESLFLLYFPIWTPLRFFRIKSLIFARRNERGMVITATLTVHYQVPAWLKSRSDYLFP